MISDNLTNDSQYARRAIEHIDEAAKPSNVEMPYDEYSLRVGTIMAILALTEQIYDLKHEMRRGDAGR